MGLSCREFFAEAMSCRRTDWTHPAGGVADVAAAQAAALEQLQRRSARWASHTAGAAVGAVVLAYWGPHAAHIAAFMRQLAHDFIRPQVPGLRPPACGTWHLPCKACSRRAEMW